MINTDPKHKHTYDAKGKMTCCSLDEKIDSKTGKPHLHENAVHNHSEDEEDGHEHDHEQGDSQPVWREYLPAIISFVLLITGLVFDYFIKPEFFQDYFRLCWYLVAYIPVGLPVMKDAVKSIGKGEFFSESFLMSIATIGAFCIKEYSEGVAVMLFYAIGELFQTAAVSRAKRSIKTLLDIRPDTVNVSRNGTIQAVSPSEIQLGEIIQVKPGEKVALDGELISETASFNTAALTGESAPDTKSKGEAVLAGMINLNSVSDIKVTALFKDSKLSKILQMVQDATARKSPTQLFISKFAKIYTPIVVFLAIGICLVPYLFLSDYVFTDWLYKALVFLVISCPCALVISIPLGYFGGIGLA
ncbi:MAG TPA: HAD-IC family P-type ATPase, partial [Puia sp.]|nr:HAD-IC family P-type ATPase [Puia sp.]